MNGSWNEKFFLIEMATRTDTVLDQLNHIIDVTFSDVEKFESFNRYTTLQSLYTALGHQLQDGLMDQHHGALYYSPCQRACDFCISTCEAFDVLNILNIVIY